MNIFIITVLLLFLIGCSEPGLPPGDRAAGFLLGNQFEHMAVIDELKDRDIPFEINSKGLVVYLNENKAAVLGIIRKVQYGDSLNDSTFESALLNSNLIRLKYEEAFKKEMVPYQITSHEGIVEIVWSQKYSPQVDLIRQRMNEGIMTEYKSSLKEGKMEPLLPESKR